MQLLSDFSNPDWSKAMVNNNTDHTRVLLYFKPTISFPRWHSQGCVTRGPGTRDAPVKMSAGEANQPWESYITDNWAKEIEKTLNTELNERQTFFKTARKMCKENRLREFQFTFVHILCDAMYFRPVYQYLHCCTCHHPLKANQLAFSEWL